jgi:hypothetical protein
VRDFGIGLTGDQVQNIYTTYFESTKTDSNDYIGALGLGSKSPFSYTENFIVTAIKDGTKRIYSAFINEMGVPSIAEMSAELTDEINGVEVKFSVTDRYDYQSFVHEARYVFKWFEHKPTITGHDFTHSTPVYKEKNIVPGVHTLGEQTYTSLAVMGNIVYPIKITEPQKHFGDLAMLLENGLVLDFKIGEVDFAASREELSYVPLTINSIRTKLEALQANLVIHFAAKADAITDEWERALFLYSSNDDKLYRSIVKQYAADTKFPLYDLSDYYGRKTFVYPIADLEKRKLSIHTLRVNRGMSQKITSSFTTINNASALADIIPVQQDLVIVLNDLKTGCVARTRYHYNQAGGRHTVVCISHSDSDLAVRQAEYDKILKEMHNPPVVVMASSLNKPERKKPVSSVGIARMRLKTDARPGYECSYTWEPVVGELDENQTYYYVCLNNHTPIDTEGKPFGMAAIKAQMDECGVSSISGIEVYGVRKSRVKEISQLDNWVWIEDKLKEETAKITDKHIASLVVAEIIDQYTNRVYTNKSVAAYLSKTSPYAVFNAKYGSIKRVSGSPTSLVALCGKYGKTVQVDTVRDSISKEQQVIHNRYPLLQYVDRNVPDDVIRKYVDIVDKS